MIPFCDTPKQSAIIAVVVGFTSGLIGLYTNNIQLTIFLAIFLAITLELITHEVRKDEQYTQAKEQLIK